MSNYSYSDPLDELYAVYISTRIYLDRYDNLLDQIFQKKMEKFSNEILDYFNSKTIIQRYEIQQQEKQYREKTKQNNEDEKNPAG
ncbi:hypothetical protein [Thiolapillus sp.]|uniref:hypothetical protein n=1 Tax=Thiolapillus sp. TaxID=2017437 RepID=UPI003AF8E7E5